MFKKTRLIKYVTDKKIKETERLVNELFKKYEVDKLWMRSPESIIPDCKRARLIIAYSYGQYGIKYIHARAIAAELNSRRSVFLYVRYYGHINSFTFIGLLLSVGLFFGVDVNILIGAEILLWAIVSTFLIAAMYGFGRLLECFEDRRLRHLARKIEPDNDYFKNVSLDDRLIIKELAKHN